MIVVTGATGKVGASLVTELLAAKAQFRVLARDPRKLPAGVTAVQGDLGDEAARQKAFAGATKLFVLTNSTPDSAALQNAVIDAAKRAGVPHVVRLSVLGADEKSPVTLSRWHAQTDAHLKASGLKWTILQPGYFMQNTLSAVPTVKKDGAIYGNQSTGKFAPIDARDIGAAAAKVLTSGGHEGQTYVLTGQELLTNQDIAAKIGKRLGTAVKYVSLPDDAFRGALLQAGLPDWLAQDYVLMGQTVAQGHAASTAPALKTLLGKTRTFDDFLEAYGSAFA